MIGEMLKIAGHTLVSRLMAAALSFGIVIQISRLLGPEERGLCSLYVLIVSIAVVIGEMAGGSASVFLLKRYNPHFLQKLQWVWAVVPSIGVPLIFYGFKAINLQELFIIMAACWANCAFTLQQHVLLGMQKFWVLNLLHLVNPGLTLLLFWGLAQWETSKYSFYFSTLISWLSIFVTGYIIIQFRYKKEYLGHQPFRLDLYEIFKAGTINQLGHLVSLFNTRLLFFILPAVQLGVWSNTLSIAEGLFLIAGSLGQTLYSKIVGDKENVGQQKKWFHMALVSNLVLTFLASFMVYMVPDSVWIYLFGKGFGGISDLFSTLFWGIIFQSIFLLLTYRLSASGLFNKNLYALLWGSGANLGITLMLLASHTYTLKTGIMALCVGWTIAALAAYYFLHKHIPQAIRLRKK